MFFLGWQIAIKQSFIIYMNITGLHFVDAFRLLSLHYAFLLALFELCFLSQKDTSFHLASRVSGHFSFDFYNTDKNYLT